MYVRTKKCPTLQHKVNITILSCDDNVTYCAVRTGISDNMVRLSVGVEHVDDLLADLKQALEGALHGNSSKTV